MKIDKPISLKIDADGFGVINCSDSYGLLSLDIVSIVDHQAKTDTIFKYYFNDAKKYVEHQFDYSGYYFCKAKVVDGSGVAFNVETVPKLFILRKKKNEIYQNLMGAESVLERIPYFQSPYPQVDFLIDMNGAAKRSSIEGISDVTGVDFHKYEFGNGNSLIFSTEKIRELEDGKGIFSGYSWSDGEFLFGNKSYFNVNGNFNNISNNLGNYSYVKISDNEVELGTDYLGFSRLFYFKDDTDFIVSNRYHLLLIFLKRIGTSLKLNREIVENLFLSNVTLFRQVMTHDLLVENTYLLPSFKYIKFSEKGAVFCNKELFEKLASSVDYNKSDYKKILNESAAEIRDNVEAVLRSPDFDQVIIDLSGGRDSRVGYAALTNITKELTNKVRVRSTLHEPDDLDVAIKVNNVFNYPYYEDGDLFQPVDAIKGLEQKQSYYLGYHFLWYCPLSRRQKENQIRLTGESFEALSVRYYSNVLKNPAKTVEISELVSEFSKILSRQCVLDFEAFGSQFSEQLIKVLEEIPGCSAQEKFDALFLLFRGSFHAGNLDRMHYEPACCMPLQSKDLILAKRMWQSVGNYNSVIYDITYLLNPVLAIIPYNSKKTNEEFLSHKDDLFVGESGLRDAYLDNISLNIKPWDDAFEMKRVNDLNLQEKSVFYDQKILVGETDEVKLQIFNQLEYKLCALAQLSSKNIPLNWIDDIFVPLSWYVSDFTKNSDEIRVCHHKISTLYDILSIIYTD